MIVFPSLTVLNSWKIMQFSCRCSKKMHNGFWCIPTNIVGLFWKISCLFAWLALFACLSPFCSPSPWLQLRCSKVEPFVYFSSKYLQVSDLSMPQNKPTVALFYLNLRILSWLHRHFEVFFEANLLVYLWKFDFSQRRAALGNVLFPRWSKVRAEKPRSWCVYKRTPPPYR